MVDIGKSQIYEWRKVFIETHRDKGYPIEIEGTKGMFYPEHVEERTAIEEDLGEVEVKGTFLNKVGEERQKASVYFKLNPQPDGSFKEEVKRIR